MQVISDDENVNYNEIFSLPPSFGTKAGNTAEKLRMVSGWSAAAISNMSLNGNFMVKPKLQGYLLDFLLGFCFRQVVVSDKLVKI